MILVYMKNQDSRWKIQQWIGSSARDRRLVSRPSTRTVVRHLIVAPEYRLCSLAIDFRCLAVNFLDLFLIPSYAGYFDLSILPNPENAGHVGQAICICGGVGFSVIQQDREIHAVLFHERGGVFLFVL